MSPGAATDPGAPATPRVLVIADDLTGANATGARFARRGLRTLTVRGTAELAEHVGDADVLVVDTDSRHVDAGEAAERVRQALESTGGAQLVVKRTDTTLRGNVGAEAEAALLWLRAHVSGRDAGGAAGDVSGDAAGDMSEGAAGEGDGEHRVRALMVPAFPDAGRTTVGGLQLVDGVPLSQTEVADDPRTPVRHSRVADLVRAQTDLTVGEVTLETVIAGGSQLTEALADPVDVTIVDAVGRTDLRRIAEAAARVPSTTWLSVDPGPFGPELATALGLSHTAGLAAPLLVAAGSATATTRAQLIELERTLAASFVTLDVTDLRVADGVAAVRELLGDAPPDGIVGLRTVDAETGPRDLGREEAEAIPRIIGEIVAALLEEGAGDGGVSVGGLYLTGGDVTLGTLDALECHGMTVEEEVLPLAVAGRLAGGVHDGLPIVTKGGLIGDEQAAVTCLDHLRARVTQS